MSAIIDGPASSLFFPLPFRCKDSVSLDSLAKFGASEKMVSALAEAQRGAGL